MRYWMSPASRGRARRGRDAQALLDAVGFVAQAVGAAVARCGRGGRAVDLPLDGIDPHLQRPHLAPVAVAIAIAVAGRRLAGRLRIILGGGRAGGSMSRTGGSQGKNNLRITALLVSG